MAEIESNETCDDSPETRQKPRRWRRFRLRTLFLLILLAALPLSWIAARHRQAARERAAIEAIREVGGTFGFYGRRELFGWKAPVWAHELAGSGPRVADLWFREPSEFSDADAELLVRLDPLPALSLHNTQVTDRGLETLSQHRGIQRLDLKGTPVSDEGLRYVAAMSQLTSLDLRETKVTCTGIELIGEMPNLQVLELGGPLINDEAIEKLAELKLVWIGLRKTDITDKSLAHLTKMPLRHGYFDDSRISDTGMKELARIRTLKVLDVSGTRITDVALAAFSNHPRLTALDVDDTSIGDKGLQAVVSVPRLLALDMANTAVTDEGLRHLIQAKRLNRIDLQGTVVSDQGIAQLNALPTLGTLKVSRTNVRNPAIVKLRGIRNWDLFYRDQDDFPPPLMNYIP